jgi:hypothetical protein
MCGNDYDDGAHVIHVYWRSNKGGKNTREHAQTQMYVFKKTTHHIVRFDRNKKRTGILHGGMAMYVECDAGEDDDDERSPSLSLF